MKHLFFLLLFIFTSEGITKAPKEINASKDSKSRVIAFEYGYAGIPSESVEEITMLFLENNQKN